MNTPVSSMALVFVASLIGSFGSVFLKSGAGKLRLSIRHLLLNYRLALGVLLFLISTCFYFMGIRQGELSVLYPMVSLGYIWTLVWSRLFFGEPITRNKFAGLFLILLGIFFIGLGKQ
jgi:drug/metabolite transporter (DMT)-like permease